MKRSITSRTVNDGIVITGVMMETDTTINFCYWLTFLKKEVI